MLIGASYRFDIADDLAHNASKYDVFEILLDQYLSAPRRRRLAFDELARRVPCVAHGLGLSLGSDVPDNAGYLDRVADVLERLQVSHYSEHLAFSRVLGAEVDDLLPIPLTEETLDLVTRRLERVRRRVRCQVLIENVPKRFLYDDSKIDEAEFLNRLCDRTGVGVLLDVENAYSDQRNWGRSAADFVAGLASGTVEAIHLAGGEEKDGIYVDDHAHDMPEAVLDLFEVAAIQHKPSMAIVERDWNCPDSATLEREVDRVRSRLAAIKLKEHLDVVVA